MHAQTVAEKQRLISMFLLSTLGSFTLHAAYCSITKVNLKWGGKTARLELSLPEEELF